LSSPFWVSLVFLAEESGEQGFVLGALLGDVVAVVAGEVEEVAFGDDVFTFMANYTQKRNACTKTLLSHGSAYSFQNCLGFLELATTPMHKAIF